MAFWRVSFNPLKRCDSSPGEASPWQRPDAAEDAVHTGAANHGMRALTIFQVQAHVAHISLNL